MSKLPLFYKDKAGKWCLFPLKDFSHEDGRWWLTHSQVIGCDDQLRHFLQSHDDKLLRSFSRSGYYLKDD